VAGRIEQSYLRQIAPLPPMTSRLLLLAASERRRPALLWRRSDRLGIGRGGGSRRVRGELLNRRAGEFRHTNGPLGDLPVVLAKERREGASRAGAGDDHAARPGSANPCVAPRAGAAGTTRNIAAELARSADRAHASGGLAAAAALLQRYDALTLEPARRAKASTGPRRGGNGADGAWA